MQKQREPLSGIKSVIQNKLNTVEWVIEKYVGRLGYTVSEVQQAIDAAKSGEPLVNPPSTKTTPPAIQIPTIDRAKFSANLNEMDTASDVAPPERIKAFADKLKLVLPPDLLEEINVKLRAKKAGIISYDDIAFMGLVHVNSVSNNYRNGAKYANTSPKDRITKTSKTFGYRETEFDPRQVAHGIWVLEQVGFTTMIAKAEVGVSATYKVSEHPFWREILD